MATNNRYILRTIKEQLLFYLFALRHTAFLHKHGAFCLLVIKKKMYTVVFKNILGVQNNEVSLHYVAKKIIINQNINFIIYVCIYTQYIHIYTHIHTYKHTV